jgi:hypothetical protein
MLLALLAAPVLPLTATTPIRIGQLTQPPIYPPPMPHPQPVMQQAHKLVLNKTGMAPNSPLDTRKQTKCGSDVSSNFRNCMAQSHRPLPSYQPKVNCTPAKYVRGTQTQYRRIRLFISRYQNNGARFKKVVKEPRRLITLETQNNPT